MRRGRVNVAVVGNEPAPPAQPAKELGLYAEVRAAAQDAERWRRLHERSHKAAPINVPDKVRRVFAMKGSCRFERGGFKFEERL